MLYTTSGGEGVLLVSTEHRGSWLLSTDVKYFISSVSCLISLRRAAFCFSRSSLSCEGEVSALMEINFREGARLEEQGAGRTQIRFSLAQPWRKALLNFPVYVSVHMRMSCVRASI